MFSYEQNIKTKGFAARCEYFGRKPEETSQVGLVALENGLSYESSSHAVLCAQHGLSVNTSPREYEIKTGLNWDETSVRL